MPLEVAIPSELHQLGPAWLNAALSSPLRGGKTIVGARVDRLGGVGSFVGDIGRVSLDYEAPGGGLDSLIVKIPTSDEGARKRFAAAGFYRRENAFYQQVADSISVRTPLAYHVDSDEESTRYVLLLEDLGHMRAGDHLAGCSQTEARLVLSNLAKLHSRWWNDPALARFAHWLPVPNEAQTEAQGAAFRNRWSVLEGSLAGIVPEEFLAVAMVFGTHFSHVWRLQGLAPAALNHGDCRLENMLFGAAGADDNFALVDWQAVNRGNPLRDVAYFLAANFEPNQRRQEQQHLLAFYFDQLIANGITGYSFEDCWLDFRRAGLLLVSAALWVAGSLDPLSPLQPGQDLLRRVVGRLALTVLDLEPMSLLDT